MKVTVCKNGVDIFATELTPTSRAEMYKEYIIERVATGFDLYSRYDNLTPTWIGKFDNVASVAKWFEMKSDKPAPTDFIESL